MKKPLLTKHVTESVKEAIACGEISNDGGEIYDYVKTNHGREVAQDNEIMKAVIQSLAA